MHHCTACGQGQSAHPFSASESPPPLAQRTIPAPKTTPAKATPNPITPPKPKPNPAVSAPAALLVPLAPALPVPVPLAPALPALAALDAADVAELMRDERPLAMDEPALERDEREDPAAEVAEDAAEVTVDAPLVADAPTEEAALDAISRRDGGTCQRTSGLSGVFVNRWQRCATMSIENDGGDGDDPGSDMNIKMGMEGSAPCTRLRGRRGEQRYHSPGNTVYLEHACHEYECGEARDAEGKR